MERRKRKKEGKREDKKKWGEDTMKRGEEL